MDMTQILGLTCISEQLKEKDKTKYSFRTMTRKRFNDLTERDGRDEAIKELSIRIIHNIHVIRRSTSGASYGSTDSNAVLSSFCSASVIITYFSL